MMIGQAIRIIRKAKGLTQEELAQRLSNKDRTRISRFETGEQKVMAEDLKEIATVLETPVSDFLG